MSFILHWPISTTFFIKTIILIVLANNIFFLKMGLLKIITLNLLCLLLLIFRLFIFHKTAFHWSIEFLLTIKNLLFYNIISKKITHLDYLLHTYSLPFKFVFQVPLNYT